MIDLFPSPPGAVNGQQDKLLPPELLLMLLPALAWILRNGRDRTWRRQRLSLLDIVSVCRHSGLYASFPESLFCAFQSHHSHCQPSQASAVYVISTPLTKHLLCAWPSSKHIIQRAHGMLTVRTTVHFGLQKTDPRP